jgi:hypothetical protein
MGVGGAGAETEEETVGPAEPIGDRSAAPAAERMGGVGGCGVEGGRAAAAAIVPAASTPRSLEVILRKGLSAEKVRVIAPGIGTAAVPPEAPAVERREEEGGRGVELSMTPKVSSCRVARSALSSPLSDLLVNAAQEEEETPGAAEPEGAPVAAEPESGVLGAATGSAPFPPALPSLGVVNRA